MLAYRHGPDPDQRRRPPGYGLRQPRTHGASSSNLAPSASGHGLPVRLDGQERASAYTLLRSQRSHKARRALARAVHGRAVPAPAVRAAVNHCPRASVLAPARGLGLVNNPALFVSARPRSRPVSPVNHDPGRPAGPVNHDCPARTPVSVNHSCSRLHPSINPRR